MLNSFIAANANLIKMVQRQAPVYFRMARPMAIWGVPAAIGVVWFTWPAGSGAYLFGIGAPKEEEEGE